MEVLLGLGVAVSFGISDVIGGAAGRRTGPLRAITGVQIVGVVILGGYLWAIDRSPGDGRQVLLSGVAGLVLAFSAISYYSGLSWGRMGVVAPVTFATISLLTVAIGLGRGERPSALDLAGVVLIILGVTLIPRPPRGRRGADPPPGATTKLRVGGEVAFAASAGGGFAVFQLLLLEIGVEEGPAPLLVVRAVGVVLGLAALGVIRLRSRSTRLETTPAASPVESPVAAPPEASVKSPAAAPPEASVKSPVKWLLGTPRRRTATAIVVAGVTLVSAHWFLIEALNRGFLSIVGPITTLTPAFIMLGARVYLREHINPTQIVGTALIIAGLILVATG